MQSAGVHFRRPVPFVANTDNQYIPRFCHFPDICSQAEAPECLMPDLLCQRGKYIEGILKFPEIPETSRIHDQALYRRLPAVAFQAAWLLFVPASYKTPVWHPSPLSVQQLLK